MDKKENLRFLLNSNKSAITKLVNDITDEESLFRGKDNLQHIRWQTGHIVYNAYLVLRTIGETVPLPDGWYDMFRRGCAFAEDTATYPSMTELREKLNDYYDQIGKRLDELSDNDLDRTLDPEPIFETTAMNTALFFCTHEFYHAGQITTLRRLLGREQPFG